MFDCKKWALSGVIGITAAAGIAQVVSPWPFPIAYKTCPGSEVTVGANSYVVPPFICPVGTNCTYVIVTDDEGRIIGATGACATLA